MNIPIKVSRKDDDGNFLPMDKTLIQDVGGGIASTITARYFNWNDGHQLVMVVKKDKKNGI